MSNDAPVCNVKGVVQEPNQSVTSDFQAIPKATDLASALAAIQALANNMNNLFRRGNFVQSHVGGISGFSTKKAAAAPGNYIEVQARRVYKTVRVYNPQDATQYVDVKQIVGLTFVDPVTRRTIVWKQ